LALVSLIPIEGLQLKLVGEDIKVIWRT